jgi:hypothetical protein
VFQNLKNVNYRIIVNICPAHTLHNAAKKSVYKMAVDDKVLTVKIFTQFTSSAKHTAASNSAFALVDSAQESQ